MKRRADRQPTSLSSVMTVEQNIRVVKKPTLTRYSPESYTRRVARNVPILIDTSASDIHACTSAAGRKLAESLGTMSMYHWCGEERKTERYL